MTEFVLPAVLPGTGSCAPHNSPAPPGRSWAELADAVNVALPIDELFHRLFPGAEDPTATLTFCPFHENRRSPALHLMTRVNRYKCFGCGARGDAADLVRAALARVEPDRGREHALRVAARLAGIAEAFSGAHDTETLAARLAIRENAREAAARRQVDPVRMVLAKEAETRTLERLSGVVRRADDALWSWFDWLEDELQDAAAAPIGEGLDRMRTVCAGFDGALARFDAAEDWEPGPGDLEA